MSSSQNFSVYKTLPYSIYARAAGKWDYLQTNQVYNSSQTVNIAMSNYDGLSMTAETQGAAALPLNFSNTVLPWKWDYYDYLETDKYCFMPVGQWYEGVTALTINAELVGNLTIDGNYNVSGFDGNSATSAYAYIDDAFNPANDTWEIGIKFHYTQYSNYQTIIAPDTQSKMNIYFQINSSRKAVLGISSNGSRYDIMESTSNTYTFVDDTNYWVKIEFTGTSYVASVSDDNWATSTTLFNTSSSSKIYAYKLRFGMYADRYGPYAFDWKGSIDFNNAYIKINNQTWWQGLTLVTSSRKGCTYNYTDDGSAVTLNAFVVDYDKSVVLTPDNSYTNGYYLGTVNVPAHDVYTYSETSTPWTQPVLSTNGTIGGDSFAVATSDNNSNFWKAFDGDTSTYFNKYYGSGTYWLEFYNPQSLQITNIQITNPTGYSGFITKYDFQYSDDNISWSVAIEDGVNTETGQGKSWNINVPNIGSHKYYRIFVKSTSYGGNIYVAEIAITANEVTGTWTKQTAIPWTQPALSANGTMGGSTCACAMDSTWDSRRIAYKAFDGNTILSNYETDTAHSNNGYPHWIAFYSPDDIKVTSVTIYNGNDAYVPADYQFQCSDDYSTWTTIASGTNTVGTDGMQGGQWSFNIPTANQGYHKYYRFYATSALQGSGYWNQFMALTEIQLTALVEASN